MAIYQNQKVIFYKLLSSNKIDVDDFSSKGTAMHFACRMNKLSYVRSLVECGARYDLKSRDGYLPVDLTTNCDIVELFSKKVEEDIKKIKGDDSKSQINLANLVEDTVWQEKPPIVKGEMHKIGNSGFTLNKRFFVLNAEEGTLIRFRSKNDFPLKPM